MRRMSVALDLPALTADEAAHSERLAEALREIIRKAGGWIGFGRFMEAALYEPGLGYYSAGAHKLGPAGDFITAPEVAPVFSRCLARQCAEVLEHLGGGDVLELGAGSGVMAAALLAELERLGRLPGRYRILDVSADLRERQRRTLAAAVPHLLERVEWLDALPEPFDGVTLANEVLDALPVERFVVRGGEVNALGVAWQFDRFEAAEARASKPSSVRRCPMAMCRRSTSGSRRGCRRWRPCSVAACSSSSTTACRAASTTQPSAATAPCCATSGTAFTTIRSRGSVCRTSRPGWISPPRPRRRRRRDSTWPATRPRRIS
jgi:SAM-dependent methyltransferase